MLKRSIALSSCLALTAGFLAAPGVSASPSPSPAAESRKPASTLDAPIDPCTLLTKKAIEAVVGEPVKETKMQRQEEEGFVISQCIFLLPTMTNTVTLRLVQRGAGEDARDPRTIWQETFERDLAKAEKSKKAPPERVPNVGDEAFWLGGRETGGLYVLKGNRHFRLGLGGEPNQARKIEKATKLARQILERL